MPYSEITQSDMVKCFCIQYVKSVDLLYIIFFYEPRAIALLNIYKDHHNNYCLIVLFSDNSVQNISLNNEE